MQTVIAHPNRDRTGMPLNCQDHWEQGKSEKLSQPGGAWEMRQLNVCGTLGQGILEQKKDFRKKTKEA